MRQQALPLYIAFLGSSAAGILAVAGYAVSRMPMLELLHWAPQALLFAGLGWLGSRYRVLISESSIHVMSTSAQVATLLVLPLPIAVIVVGASRGLREVIRFFRNEWTRGWREPVVNVGGTLLANAAGGAGFALLDGNHHLWSRDLHTLLAFPALVALVVIYPAVQVLTVMGAIILTTKELPVVVFRHLTRGALLPEASLILVGIVFAVVWHLSPILSLFIIMPMIFTVRSFESAARLRKETVEAVLKMAESIDFRDTGTYEHSQRLENYTRGLAIALGLTLEHVNDIVLASKVHDLGKIGISNDILLKPGPLTPEERRLMEQHPVIGATILSSYTQFQSSVDIVRHHHERWDGRGYPDGLHGEEIPLGARIIAVVDAFDSMTADRPYRKGMSVEIAVERLKDSMWSQFDPRVCATFIQMLIEEGMYRPPQPAPDLRIVPRASAS